MVSVLSYKINKICTCDGGIIKGKSGDLRGGVLMFRIRIVCLEERGDWSNLRD